MLHFREKMPKNFQTKEIYQIRFTVENRRGAQSSFHVMQGRSKSLEERVILLRIRPERRQKERQKPKDNSSDFCLSPFASGL
jgi:hypothetical protein